MGHLQLDSLQPEIDALKQAQFNLNNLKYRMEIITGEGDIHKILPELKSVFCNYRGRVTVYDVNSEKVHDLSGQLTYETYIALEKRINWDTIEFDGQDHYERISKELVREFKKNNSTVYFNNITDTVQEVEVFGAHTNKASNNYGNPDGVIVSGENYQGILNDIKVKPIKIESLRVCSYSDELNLDILIKNINANGLCSQVLFYMKSKPTQFNSNIVQEDKQIIINIGTSMSFKLKPNEKVGIDIKEDILVFNIYE